MNYDSLIYSSLIDFKDKVEQEHRQIRQRLNDIDKNIHDVLTMLRTITPPLAHLDGLLERM